MAHPMHLHGHYFKVAAINNVTIEGASRDTVLVPPSTFVTIRLAADNSGNWAFHCHDLYHMNAGMMGAIRYSNAARKITQKYRGNACIPFPSRGAGIRCGRFSPSGPFWIKCYCRCGGFLAKNREAFAHIVFA